MMAGIPLADAFVRIRADTSGVRRETERGLSGAGFDKAGDNAGRQFGGGFNRALAGAYRDAAGRLRDENGRFVAAGSSAGRAFGDGFTRDATGRLRDARGRFAAEGGSAGGAFGHAFGRASGSGISGMQGLIAAGISLGPLLVPAAAAATAAVAAIGPAALAGAAGLGVAALAAVGVVEAVKAMAAVEEQAAQSGATMAAQQAAVASAADQVRSAERSLANTRTQVAEGARRAARQVADAQRDLTVAEKDALQVRRDLSRAQQEARQALEDLDSAVRGNALDQRQATLDVTEAQAELQRVLSDPKATDLQRRQAQLTYERQVAQVDDLQRRGRRLQTEQQEATRAGIAGSEQVVAARRRIADADERVADSQRALSDARRAQAEQERQASYQLAQAQQAVTSAQRSLNTATVQAGAGGSAAVRKLSNAMKDLSPQGRAFATFVFGLRDEFLSLRQAAERGLLPGVQAGIQALLPYLPQMRVFVERIGRALGGLAKSAGEALASPFWADFFDWLGSNAAPMLADFGAVVGGLARGFAGLLKAFSPTSKQLVSGLADIASAFADWATSLSGSAGFKEFLDYVKANGPVLGKLFLDLAVVTLKLLVALAPLATVMLAALGGLAGWLATLDPGVLLAIAGAVAVVVAAIAGPFAAIAAVVVAFAGVWVLAYQRIDVFRKAVNLWFGFIARWVMFAAAAWQTAFRLMSTAVQWAWTTVIQPALSALRAFIVDKVGPVVLWLWRHVVEPALTGIRLAVQVAWALIRVVFGLIVIYIRGVLAPVFTWLWRTVIQPVWSRITATISAAWAKIRPVFQALGGFIKSNVVPAFRTGVDAIGKAWERIRDVAKVPVRFVVDTVLNKAIIDNYNKLARKFGVGTVDRVSLPRGFARGGVLPGYTPGRDVHRFVSASGGVLDLSGGEAILRPEATRALGKGWVDNVNAAARSGGRGGVQRALGYADGGIFDLFKSAKRKATDVLRGGLDLINPGEHLRRVAGKVLALTPGAGTDFGRLMTAIPRKLINAVADRLTSILSVGPDGGPGNGASPFGGSAGMMRILRAIFPGLRLISGYRAGSRTLSGNRSYHASDRAVDLPPRRDVAEWISRTFRDITKELITPFQEFNLLNGRPYHYSGAVWNQHNFAGGNAHDHWAARLGGLLPKLPIGVYDTGGYLPTGLSLAYNGTGAPEPVGAGVTIQLVNRGVIGSQRELDNWLVGSVTRLRQERRLPGV